MNDQKKKICAVVLSAGRGRRMESVIQKQYMCLNGKPMIAHTLAAFERSCVDEIILVAGAGEEEYCRKEIVEAEGFRKVKTVVTGGKERYDSVFAGLKAASGCDYVLIHDGARPCVTEEIIRHAAVGAEQYGACVVGMRTGAISGWFRHHRHFLMIWCMGLIRNCFVSRNLPE